MNRLPAIAAILAAALLAAGLGWFARIAAMPPEAPAFTLHTTTGKRQRLVDYRGRLLVINFWAPWCMPCRREMPMLSAFAHDNPTIAVLGIAVDAKPAVMQYLESQPVTYPILIGTRTAALQDRYVAARDPTDVLPYTVIVNRKGRIVSQMAGRLTPERLRRALAPYRAGPNG